MSDLLQLLDIIFRHALETNGKLQHTSPYSRYYIASTTTHDWRAVSDRFAIELHKRGLVSSPMSISVPYEEAGPLAM